MNSNQYNHGNFVSRVYTGYIINYH